MKRLLLVIVIGLTLLTPGCFLTDVVKSVMAPFGRSTKGNMVKITRGTIYGQGVTRIVCLTQKGDKSQIVMQLDDDMRPVSLVHTVNEEEK